MPALNSYLPCLSWARRYQRDDLSADLLAAAIVTVMLIPQSLAYALLAGLPVEVGLYASLAPLVLYGLFGSSRVLAVGPVAVVSLMTAAALGEVAQTGTPEYLGAALALAALSGLILLAMGFARLGFMANFLSHPVTNGFISASALLIAASQLKHLFGVESSGHDLVTVLTSLGSSIAGSNPWTCIIGVSTLLFLVGLRRLLGPTLQRVGVQAGIISVATRVGPALAVVTAATATWLFDLSARGVAIVGTVPQGLPPLSLPPLDLELWQSLFVSAALISVVGFVESVSVAQTLAAKRRQRIEPDQELIGLGAANLGAAFTGGYPVTGGFARSVVNFDAGARTPAAGIFTAMTIALATLTLTPALYYLPNAVLAATIIVAVLGLIDMGSLTSTWRYSKADFSAQLSTIVLTLGVGIEAGIMVGVGVSIALYLYRTSRPHYAAVGQVPGTEHFRNIERHDVVTDPQVLNLRVDESLYFPNARFLEDAVVESVSQAPKVRHVVLMCSAVNDIDASALESIETINARLSDAGIGLHLSEVKGPVMDRLQRSHLLEHLNGHVYLTQFDAFAALAPVAAQRAMNAVRVTS